MESRFENGIEAGDRSFFGHPKDNSVFEDAAMVLIHCGN